MDENETKLKIEAKINGIYNEIEVVKTSNLSHESKVEKINTLSNQKYKLMKQLEKLAYEHLIEKSVTITKELVEECKNDEELCEVAFGQEEDRDLNYILGQTITISKDGDYCLFDDEYGNDYLEVKISDSKYNIPVKFLIYNTLIE